MWHDVFFVLTLPRPCSYTQQNSYFIDRQVLILLLLPVSGMSTRVLLWDKMCATYDIMLQLTQSKHLRDMEQINAVHIIDEVNMCGTNKIQVLQQGGIL